LPICQTELEKTVKLDVAAKHRRHDEQGHRKKSKCFRQTTPRDCLNITRVNCESAIKFCPKANSQTSVFHLQENTAARQLSKREKHKDIIRLREKNVSAEFTAKKKRTNDVSTRDFFLRSFGLNLLMRDSVS
jgi:hypothetical protein